MDGCGYVKPAGTHIWGQWVAGPEGKHTRTCTITTCGGSETKDCTPSEEYTSDDTNHWRACTVCGSHNGKGTHLYTDSYAYKDAEEHVAFCICGESEDQNHDMTGTEVFGTGTEYFVGTKTCTVTGCGHIVSTEYGARIGDVGYTDLNAALNAISDGQTVDINTGMGLTTITIPTNTFTTGIILNGKGGVVSNQVTITGSGVVTVRDITFNATTGAAIILNDNVSGIVFSGCNFTGTDPIQYNGAEIGFSGCTFYDSGLELAPTVSVTGIEISGSTFRVTSDSNAIDADFSAAEAIGAGVSDNLIIEDNDVNGRIVVKDSTDKVDEITYEICVNLSASENVGAVYDLYYMGGTDTCTVDVTESVTYYAAVMFDSDLSGSVKGFAGSEITAEELAADGTPMNIDSGTYYPFPTGNHLLDCGAIDYVVKVPAGPKKTVEATEGLWIGDADGLFEFAEAVNGGMDYDGKTVKLVDDISLEGRPWTPAGGVNGYPSITFAGTFDGNGMTISHMVVSDTTSVYASAGFFGSITGVVMNLTISEAVITSTHYAGGICGYSSANVGMEIINCHVERSTITSVPEQLSGSGYDNGDKAGGIIGYIAGGDKVTGCTVKDTVITAYRDLGGLVGCSGGTISAGDLEGNMVEGVTLIQDNTNGYKEVVPNTYGSIFGRSEGNTISEPDASRYSGTKVQVKFSEGSFKIPMSDIVFGDGTFESVEVYGASEDGSRVELTDDYRSKFSERNMGLSIHDLTIFGNNTEDTTWDLYDVLFGCDVTIKDVTFEKSIAFVDLSTVILTDVTVEETSGRGDSYAIWIEAGCAVTISGSKIVSKSDDADERGIKISDQYVEGTVPATKLVITGTSFETEKKSAILVGSKGDVSIDYSNIDVTKVQYNIDSGNGIVVTLDESYKSDIGKVVVNEEPYTFFEDYVGISTPEQLLAFADSVNDGGKTYLGTTVILLDDINLNGVPWTPIGQTGGTQFMGTFDGNRFTISGLNIDTTDNRNNSNYSTGLFGWLNKGVVKDLVIDGAQIKGNKRVGAIAGYLELGSTIQGCEVRNAVISGIHHSDSISDASNKNLPHTPTDTWDCGDKVGSIVGYMNAVDMVLNCHAYNVKIDAARDAGQIVGAGQTLRVLGCTADAVEVSSNTTECKGGNINNSIIGRILGTGTLDLDTAYDHVDHLVVSADLGASDKGLSVPEGDKSLTLDDTNLDVNGQEPVISVGEGSSLTLGGDDTTLSGNDRLINTSEGSTVTINEGSYDCSAIIWADYYTDLRINGGDFDIDAVVIADNPSYDILITGGTFDISKEFTGNQSVPDGCTFVITGGSFNIDPTKFVDTTEYNVVNIGGMYTVTAIDGQ